MSRIYGRGHDINIDGNERMNIRCERESCVMRDAFSLDTRFFLCFCSGANEEQCFCKGRALYFMCSRFES